MIRWFRRRRPPVPAPVAPVLPQLDRIALVSWGLSSLEWADMDFQTQAWHRENLTKAPYFTTYTHAS